MKAADIMSTNVVVIDSFATIFRAAQLMTQHHVRTLIVERTSTEDAYGIITTTDIARAVANLQNPVTTYVSEVMTKPCVVVNPDLAIEHLVNLFVRANIRVAPVIKDQLLGIVSLSDLLTKTTSLHLKIPTLNYLNPSQFALDELGEKEGEINVIEEYDNWCRG